MPNIRPLSAELQKAAIEQVFEVPERIPADLEALKTWIKQQPHLKARTDDQFLIAFLRGCKYSLEKAKSKLDKYYTLRTKFPEMFRLTDVDDPKVREIASLGISLYLPNPLPNGQRIGIMRYSTYSPADYNIDDIFRVLHAQEDIMMLEDDQGMINGISYIMDMDKGTTAHLFAMTMKTMKRMTVYSEEAMPVRPKATHFLHTITGFETVFNMIKPMLSKKQQERLYVHGDKMELLYKQIPQKYLPVEYGGENGCLADLAKAWDKKFDEYREYFKEEANYGTDESLRPGKPIDFDGIFGTEGSFRKLDVD